MIATDSYFLTELYMHMCEHVYCPSCKDQPVLQLYVCHTDACTVAFIAAIINTLCHMGSASGMTWFLSAWLALRSCLSVPVVYRFYVASVWTLSWLHARCRHDRVCVPTEILWQRSHMRRHKGHYMRQCASGHKHTSSISAHMYAISHRVSTNLSLADEVWSLDAFRCQVLLPFTLGLKPTHCHSVALFFLPLC